jgi:hypothetical protein
VPARRIEENAQVLRNFKSNAPEEAFQAVIQTIQGELSHEEFEAIIKAI